MKAIPTALPEVMVLEPKVFGDARGFFFESFNQRAFDEATGTSFNFVQDNHSRSSRGVLRGLHYQIQQPQGKLVRVVRGTVFDVAVDVRRSSARFGRWVGVELSEENQRQLWVPPGFAHGFLVTSDSADFLYKTTDYYAPIHERCIAWNDPSIGIVWPEGVTPQLSAKDAMGARLEGAEVFCLTAPGRTGMASAGQLFRLMRPHQWLKNGFVLVGAVFGHRWHVATLADIGLVFAAFCAISSAVYVFNDLQDAEADRLHPVKRLRPVASGQVSTTAAAILGLLLAVVAGVLAARVGSTALTIVAVYAVINVAYTLWLKRVVVVDVFVIALGFMLRIFAGTSGVQIPPSSWLLLCGLMLALFLGFAKRRAELLAAGDAPTGRPVLLAYGPALLDQFLAITATCTILAYALYTVSPETVALHGTTQLVYTVPFIAYGMFRYLFLLHRGGSGQDAARDLLTDRHLLLTAIGWLGITLWLLA